MTYTIAYYDEVKISSEGVVYGSTATSIPLLTKEGYSFSGWYTYGGQLYDLSKTPTSDVDLYARWSIQSYSIIYLNEDGSVYQQMTYTFGSDLSTHEHPGGPLKTHYDFAEWIGIIPSSMPSENIILTPTYTKRIGVIYVVITITIVYEDGSEDIITIEVPEDEVDDIIEQYGEGNVSTN
jgi:internalin A